MLLTQLAGRFYDAILTLAYPHPCTICGRSVESREHVPCCGDCWKATQVFSSDEYLCWKCGVIASQSIRVVEPERIRCGRCDDRQFETARAGGVYEGALRESVLLLKRQPFLSRCVIDLLVNVAQRPPLTEATRIVPVPLHAERELRRGFNQSLVIARAISPRLNLVVDDTTLTRITGSSKYRAGLDARGRFDTVADAFSVRMPQLIAGEVILLVDDVFTTGATSSSCAEALLAAGAKAVKVLTIARPPG